MRDSFCIEEDFLNRGADRLCGADGHGLMTFEGGIEMTKPDFAKIRWLEEGGEPVACIEKLRVLTESLSELQQQAQDAFEDALVIGCAERQVRAVLEELIATLHNPYRKRPLTE